MRNLTKWSVAAMLLAAPLSADAAIRTWDGMLDDTTVSSDWFNSQNWGGTAPSGTSYGDGVKFQEGAATKIVNLSASTAVNSLTFSSSAGWTIGASSGSPALSIGWNGISSSGSGTNTISVGLTATDYIGVAVAAGNELDLTGTLNAAGFGFRKSGDGLLRITSAAALGNAYTNNRPLAASAGTLELGFGDGSGTRFVQASGTGTIKLIANNQFSTGSTANYIAVDGSGLIDMNGYSASGKQLFVGALALTGIGGNGGGTVNVRTGNLAVSSATMLGGSVTGETGGTLTLSGALTSQASATTSTISSALVLAGTSGAIDVADGAAATDLAITGNITTTNNNAITKTGAGVLSFGGTVSVPVTVTAGTIGGNGTLSGSLTVDGAVAPGNSIGTLTAGATTFHAGSSLDIELGAGVSDLLIVNGNLTLAPGTILNILGTADNATNYIIASYTGTLTGDFGTPTLPDGYQIDYHYNNGVNTNNIALVYSVPEPATMSLFGLGLGLIGLRRRRR